VDHRLAKAVFTTKIEPGYDDLPEQRYHFPRTYLRAAERALGDMIVYYEPRRSSADPSSRGGRQAYFAVARVTEITPDHARPDHFYAAIADFLEFDQPVPFREGGRYYETFLQRDDGGTSKGAFGRAVRTIPDEEFEAILQAGFGPASLTDQTSPAANVLTFDDEVQATFERPIIQSIVSRPFRDEAFKRHVRLAYENRCAMTGLRIINGGGRPEVQAAHIRPVAKSGPDSVRNGIALCSTAHWMFDRGLLSVDQDFRILVATRGVPEEAARMLNSDGKVHVPFDGSTKPHQQFLEYHRRFVFKG
jgi:putative restriction endonuclease